MGRARERPQRHSHGRGVEERRVRRSRAAGDDRGHRAGLRASRLGRSSARGPPCVALHSPGQGGGPAGLGVVRVAVPPRRRGGKSCGLHRRGRARRPRRDPRGSSRAPRARSAPREPVLHPVDDLEPRSGDPQPSPQPARRELGARVGVHLGRARHRRGVHAHPDGSRRRHALRRRGGLLRTARDRRLREHAGDLQDDERRPRARLATLREEPQRLRARRRGGDARPRGARARPAPRRDDLRRADRLRLLRRRVPRHRAPRGRRGCAEGLRGGPAAREGGSLRGRLHQRAPPRRR